MHSFHTVTEPTKTSTRSDQRNNRIICPRIQILFWKKIPLIFQEIRTNFYGSYFFTLKGGVIMETTLLKLTGKLGTTLLKTTAAIFISTIAAQQSRSCMKDLANLTAQNLRYIKDKHAHT